MKSIASKISGLGALLATFGVLSAILQVGGCELRILRPLNEAEPLTAWLIRGGLIAVGALLFFLFSRKDDPAEQHGSTVSSPQEWQDWDAYRAGVRADPRFAELLAWTQGKYQVSFDPPTDPDTYQLVHWAFVNDTGQQLGPEDPAVQYLSLYLKRESKPKRLSIGKAFATGEVGATELSALQWGYVVP